MVRAHGVSKKAKGGQSDVRFVAGTTSAAETVRLSMECVRHFTKQTRAAYCYAYATQADYDVKTPDWTPEFDESNFGGSRPCWLALTGQSLNADEPSVDAENSEWTYQAADCPGEVQFDG